MLMIEPLVHDETQCPWYRGDWGWHSLFLRNLRPRNKDGTAEPEEVSAKFFLFGDSFPLFAFRVLVSLLPTTNPYL